MTGLDVDAEEEPLRRKLDRTGEVKRSDQPISLGARESGDVDDPLKPLDQGVKIARPQAERALPLSMALLRSDSGELLEQRGVGKSCDCRGQRVARLDPLSRRVVNVEPFETYQVGAGES